MRIEELLCFLFFTQSFSNYETAAPSFASLRSAPSPRGKALTWYDVAFARMGRFLVPSRSFALLRMTTGEVRSAQDDNGGGVLRSE